MKRIAVPLFLGLFVFVAGSCATDAAGRYYSDVVYSPLPVQEVEVLYKKPSRSFEVIADFQARNVNVKYMRKRAAKIGAHAIIIVRAGGHYDENETWADSDRHSGSYTRLLGTAIRYH